MDKIKEKKLKYITESKKSKKQKWFARGIFIFLILVEIVQIFNHVVLSHTRLSEFIMVFLISLNLFLFVILIYKLYLTIKKEDYYRESEDNIRILKINDVKIVSKYNSTTESNPNNVRYSTSQNDISSCNTRIVVSYCNENYSFFRTESPYTVADNSMINEDEVVSAYIIYDPMDDRKILGIKIKNLTFLAPDRRYILTPLFLFVLTLTHSP